MILFTIAALILVILTVVLILAISAVGAGAIIIFGDVIVCAFILGWIIKKILEKKKK